MRQKGLCQIGAVRIPLNHCPFEVSAFQLALTSLATNRKILEKNLNGDKRHDSIQTFNSVSLKKRNDFPSKPHQRVNGM
jgi:hypothetical protein